MPRVHLEHARADEHGAVISEAWSTAGVESTASHQGIEHARVDEHGAVIAEAWFTARVERAAACLTSTSPAVSSA